MVICTMVLVQRCCMGLWMPILLAAAGVAAEECVDTGLVLASGQALSCTALTELCSQQAVKTSCTKTCGACSTSDQDSIAEIARQARLPHWPL